MNSFSTAAFVLSAIFAPAALSAAPCPTVSDLDTGIILERTDPLFRETIRSGAAGLIAERDMDRDGTVMQVQSIFGHALAITRRRDARSDLTIEYSADLQQLDRLDQIKTLRSKTTLRINGGAPISGHTMWQFVDQTKFEIGGCTYDTWVVIETPAYDGRVSSRFQQFYAPEPGLILASVKLDPSGKPISGVTFNILRRAEETP